MKYIKLNNGIEIPLIGIGTNTFGKVNNNYNGEINYDTTELNYAIDLGYRLLDTAISYRNEAVIGKAVMESNINREEFIITTKLPGEKYVLVKDIDVVLAESLRNLNTTYLDILLIHHPWDNDEEMIKVYKHLENWVRTGAIKSIGVSNFSIEQINLIVDNCEIVPAINQIASYPTNYQDELIEHCQKLGITVQAWSPLNRVSEEMKTVLNQIGERYGKTWAQVLLKYQVSRNVVVIPKSHRYEGQKENLNIFDFKLTNLEKNLIKNLK